jgi:hypothetical protein
LETHVNVKTSAGTGLKLSQEKQKFTGQTGYGHGGD